MPIQRIVCFKFKKSAAVTERARHMADFRALKKKIPQILSYSAGKTIAGEKGDLPDYDVMHYLTYANPEEVAVYVDHPAHKDFVDRNRSLWDKVLVIASELDS
jgi:hypothetical protein